MAKESKKDLQDYTVEEKLKSLYQLQLIFSEIDRIKTLRGELPLEVEDLEDEVAGLRTRIANFAADIENLRLEENKRKAKIEEAKAMIEKYTEDQNNVRNNREYDLLAKEIEFQSLEVEFCEKKLRQYAAEQKNKQEEIARTEGLLEERLKDLEEKKAELDEIVSETKEEVSVRIHVMVLVLYMYSVMLVVAVSIRFRLSVSSMSRCVRRLSYVSIAAVS